MIYAPGTKVEVVSSQTSKSIGIIQKSEYTPFGTQYYVQFSDPDTKYEYFWMKESEICGAKNNSARHEFRKLRNSLNSARSSNEAQNR